MSSEFVGQAVGRDKTIYTSRRTGRSYLLRRNEHTCYYHVERRGRAAAFLMMTRQRRRAVDFIEHIDLIP